MRLIDTHAHLAQPRFAEDLESVLLRMRAADVAKCIVVCDPADEEPDAGTAQALAAKNDFLYFAIGVHPHNAKNWSEAAEDTVRAALADKKCVALGEIGLDYHYDFSPRDRQMAVFSRQMDIALALDKPIQMHIREAHGDTTRLLRERFARGTLPRGEMHCFSGSWETAREYIEMGLYISLSGSVTFKNAPKLWEVAKNVPADRLLVETDCPYLAPEPMRGQRNEPAYVQYTLRKIAALRAESPEILAEQIMKNANALFGI